MASSVRRKRSAVIAHLGGRVSGQGRRWIAVRDGKETGKQRPFRLRYLQLAVVKIGVWRDLVRLIYVILLCIFWFLTQTSRVHFGFCNLK